MLSQAQRRAIADELAHAERERKTVPPLVGRYEGIDVEDAYAIQLLQIGDKLDAGRLIRGHKVGLSSPAMQRMMNVTEPDYGHLLDDMFVFENTRIDVGALIQPRVEFEVAFVLGEALPAPGCTVADVLRNTAYVAPSIEIIDSRIEGWRIGLCDTIADNASSARVVLGAQARSARELDLRLIAAIATKNGEIVETGASGAVLGNPAVAVAWLANKVHQFGVKLEAGHVILPGSCTRAVDVVGGDVVTAEFSGLGSVTISFQ
ncbi:MAG: 2-keto-4-pentenoate hydratase [Myxococcota bacterium]